MHIQRLDLVPDIDQGLLKIDIVGSPAAAGAHAQVSIAWTQVSIPMVEMHTIPCPASASHRCAFLLLLLLLLLLLICTTTLLLVLLLLPSTIADAQLLRSSFCHCAEQSSLSKMRPDQAPPSYCAWGAARTLQMHTVIGANISCTYPSLWMLQ